MTEPKDGQQHGWESPVVDVLAGDVVEYDGMRQLSRQEVERRVLDRFRDSFDDVELLRLADLLRGAR